MASQKDNIPVKNPSSPVSVQTLDTKPDPGPPEVSISKEQQLQASQKQNGSGDSQAAQAEKAEDSPEAIPANETEKSNEESELDAALLPIQKLNPDEKKRLLQSSWTSMTERMTWFWRWFCNRYFREISISEERLEDIRKASEDGTVIYILHNQSQFNYLLYNHLFNEYDLPRARFAQGLYWLPWQPLIQQFRNLFGRLGRIVGLGGKGVEEISQDLVANDESILLFLHTPKTWFRAYIRRALYGIRNTFRRLVGLSRAPGGNVHNTELEFEKMVALQRRQEKPIYLCPQILIWTRTPTYTKTSFLDVVFGEKEFPGILRELYLFYRDRRESRVRGGSPINLKEFVAQHPNLSNKELAATLHKRIEDRLHKEYCAVTGPALKPSEELHELVMQNPKVEAAVQKAIEEGAQEEKVRQQAEKILLRMAAQPKHRIIQWIDFWLSVIWARIYREVVIDPDELEKVREASLKAPLLLIPSHKSHVDYLIVSQIFYRSDLVLPHIAAGDNLLIPVIGWIFRRAGAFFIRRSFGDDELYKAVFASYLEQLMLDGHHIEFFIEGGRSRTGKLRRPKMGMLTFCTDPILEGRVEDVNIIPISISYEQIIEGESYSRELLGNAKKSESLLGLLKSRHLLLRDFGALHVSFSDPISVKDYIQQHTQEEKITNPEYSPLTNEKDKRHLNQTLAHHVVYEINEGSVIPPTAIVAGVLLTQYRRGISRTELIRKVDWLRNEVQIRGGKVATIENTGSLVDRTVKSFGKMVKSPERTLETIFRPREGHRLEMGYYRNQLIHLFLSEGVIACALQAFWKKAIDRKFDQMGVSRELPSLNRLNSQLAHGLGHEVLLHELLEEVRFISRLLKLEFTYKPSPDIQDNFKETLAQMAERKIIIQEYDEVYLHEKGREPIGFLHALFWPYIDSYWVASLGLLSLLPKHDDERPVVDQKILIQTMQSIAETLFHEGNLRYSDAVSSDILKNALDLFKQSKIITRTLPEELEEKWAAKRGRRARPVLLEEKWLDKDKLLSEINRIGQFGSCVLPQKISTRMYDLLNPEPEEPKETEEQTEPKEPPTAGSQEEQQEGPVESSTLGTLDTIPEKNQEKN